MNFTIKSVVLMALTLAACTTATPRSAPPDGSATGVAQLPTRSSLFVRPAFDADGTALIGAFVPDEVDIGTLDESSLMRTRCSEFIKAKQIDASGHYNEIFNFNNRLGGNVKIVNIAVAQGDYGTSSAVRVDYQLVNKLQAEVDAAGLQRCCRAYPNQCTQRYVSQALKGHGSVYAATERINDISANGQASVESVSIGAATFFKDGLKWERTAKFNGQYFAFGLARHVTTTPVEKCSWVDTLPQDLDGLYFVGVSRPLETEQDSLEDARDNARAQVAKYLGEWIIQQSAATEYKTGATNAIQSELQDQVSRKRISEGLVQLVEMRDSCVTYGNTTTGVRWIAKVLAYFPNSQRQGAVKLSLAALRSSLKQRGRLTPQIDNLINRMAADR